MKTYKDIDQYIKEYPEHVQDILQKIRSVVKKNAPGATETISYGIPTFDLNGKHLIHFAAYKNHIGFYPTSSGIDAFKKEVSVYVWSRGTVQFPLDAPIPWDLIKKMVIFRVKESARTVRASKK
jgi:uncharacterized protein YdhG (YjbR/CyaY superfamily)